MFMKRLLGLLLGVGVLAGVLLGMAGCGDQRSQGTQGDRKYPYKVVCTVAMVSDIVRQVAGDKAQVTGLMGEGVDPHLYKPTRDDIAAIKKGDVVFYAGLLLEGKMTDALETVAKGGKPVVAVTKGIQGSELLADEGTAGHHDPHVWMDVTLWSKCVGTVAETLSAYDAKNAGEYKSRAAAYQAELAKLAEYASKTVATIPEKQRVVVTSHDAFSYFGRAYGLQVRGIQGISTESEAGLRDLENLVNFLVERQIAAVFVETSVSQKNVQALLEGARSKGREVKIGGVLFSDAMGAPGTYEGTYIGMIDHNVTTVVRALGGQAPAKGFQGKLTGVTH
jgi:manganese/zinc/iron transport system substrate-binding protein